MFIDGARHFVERHLVECNVTSNITVGRKNYRTTTFGRFFWLQTATLGRKLFYRDRTEKISAQTSFLF